MRFFAYRVKAAGYVAIAAREQEGSRWSLFDLHLSEGETLQFFEELTPIVASIRREREHDQEVAGATLKYVEAPGKAVLLTDIAEGGVA